MANYSDYQDEAFKQQLDYAAALRKAAMSPQVEMRGNIAVKKSPWETLGQSLASGWEETQAQRGQQELQQRRDAEDQAWLANKPATTEQVPMIPDPGTLSAEEQAQVKALTPADREVPIPYERQATQVQDWATKAPSRSALGQSMRAASAAQILASPQKAVEREDAQEQRRFEVLTKAEEARKLAKQQDAAAAVEKDKDRVLRRSLAELTAVVKMGQPGPSVVIQVPDGKGGFNTQIVPKTPGAVYPGAPTAAERKEAKAGKDLAGQVDEAIRIAEGSPEAFGLKTFVPGFILDRFSKDGEIDARAVVGSLKSAKIKDMSGTAVSAHEQDRLNEFLPAKGDQPKTVGIKLEAYRRELRAKGYTVEGAPPAFEVLGERDG